MSGGRRTSAISGPDYRTDEIELAGAALVVDPAGVLYWPAERLLAVADLHFEKASSFARYGALLPPYDTAATLARLCEAIMRYRPRAVFALGDSFHDGDGPQRLGAAGSRGDRGAAAGPRLDLDRRQSRSRSRDRHRRRVHACGRDRAADLPA